MAGLVVCYGPLLSGRYDLAAALQTSNDAVNGVEEVLTVHCLLVLAGGYQRGLVADVGYVGSGEAGGLLGQELHVEVRHELDLAQVYLEYLQALVLLGQVHMYLTVA